MKKSRSITLAIIGTALLATGSGCGGSSRTLYDKAGKAVPRSQWKKADGTWAKLYDANGNPVSQEEINRAYSSTSSTTSHRHYGSSGGWFFGGSGWGSSSSRSYGFGNGTSGGSVSRGGFGSTGGSHASGSS